MRKKNIVLYAFIIIALTMVITPIVTAKPYNLLNGDVYIVLQPSGSYWSWIGTVSGDIEGDLYVHLVDAWFPAPGVEHFIEEWLIVTGTGTIEGENKGKWTMANFKWIANGEVTGATGEWTHLIGSKWQYRGTTDDPFAGIIPVTGTGKFHITHNK